MLMRLSIRSRNAHHIGGDQVDILLAELQGKANSPKVRVNAVGLSRGGIACSYLAHAMADIPASRPSTNKPLPWPFLKGCMPSF